MNPSELRMMWMSQYNPERITMEDAATFFGHPSVGLSVMDDLAAQQQLELNPMMGLVSGEFSNQAAAAAAAVAASSAAVAALGVQPAALLAATNSSDIYGLAQMGGLHQQLLQQSAAAVFQNYTDMMNDDEDGSVGAAAAGMNIGMGTDLSAMTGLSNVTMTALTDGNSVGDIMDDVQQLHQQPVYDQMDDNYDQNIDELTPKQEIINIDDFVMMNDSNSYDDNDYINTEDRDISHAMLAEMANVQNLDENELLTMPSTSNTNQLLQATENMLTNVKLNMLQENLSTSNSSSPTLSLASVSNGNVPQSSSTRSHRKTRKIEPVNRPGLVLKTPIAYKGNIDPSVIPIQKDGMAVCERCGAIGVKHTFYTKSRRFCSMACARGELYSLVLHNKSTSGQQQQQQQQQQSKSPKHELALNDATSNNNSNTNDEQNENISGVNSIDNQQQLHHDNSQSDIELALRVAHIKNTNYRFRLTDQQPDTVESNETVDNNVIDLDDNSVDESLTKVKSELDEVIEIPESPNATRANQAGAQPETSVNATNNNNTTHNSNTKNNTLIKAKSTATHTDDDAAKLMPPPPRPVKPMRMYRDVLPQEELPQIPKYDLMPATCPQLEKMISVRRRAYDPTHSFDWTPRLTQANFFAAPVTCFKHAPGYDVWDNVDIDMKVEVENTDCDYDEIILPGQNVRSFWVASILKICGYKALVRYEGFESSSRDFWVNLCNAEVHSVGWCATRGKPLIPPQSITHKYRDWKDFLVARLSGARTLPTNFYNKINDSMQSRFRVGINLECVDKDHISQVRLATVTKIVGKRLLLHYFDAPEGFWCHEDAPIIHPVGWATTVGHNLAAPQDYLQRMLAGRSAMIEVHEDDATIELFKMNFTFEEYYLDGKTNDFVEGMKLEAVDPLNLSSICAATVMAVLKFGYIMIRIDSYLPDASNADWFCYHEKSPSIFPVGFCQSNNIVLTPPNGFETKTFVWDAYLRETGATAAPQHLFQRTVPNHHFEVGMSLECADLMDPRLVCVATIVRVVGRLLRIHFDGWTEEYDQWLDCESPDIYPVGWCFLVNHKLEGPPAPVTGNAKGTLATKPKVQRRRKKKTTTTAPATTIVTSNVNAATNNVKAKNTTPIVAPTITAKTSKQQQVVKPQEQQLIQQEEQQQSKNIKVQQQRQKLQDSNAVKPRTIPLRTNPDQPKLSIKLELKPEHYNAAYYDNNTGDEDDTDEEEEASAPSPLPPAVKTTTTSNIQAQKKEKKLQPNDAQSKMVKQLSDNATQLQQQQPQQQQQRSKTVRLKSPTSPPAAARKANSYIGNSSVSSTKYIPRLTECSMNNETSSNAGHMHQNNEQVVGDLIPETWNIYDVSQFLRVNECTAHCDTFSRNKVDGKRLLQLSKDDVITLLGMKVGPALKIYDLIQQLKCKVNPNKSRQQLHKPNKSAYF